MLIFYLLFLFLILLSWLCCGQQPSVQTRLLYRPTNDSNGHHNTNKKTAPTQQHKQKNKTTSSETTPFQNFKQKTPFQTSNKEHNLELKLQNSLNNHCSQHCDFNTC